MSTIPAVAPAGLPDVGLGRENEGDNNAQVVTGLPDLQTGARGESDAPPTHEESSRVRVEGVVEVAAGPAADPAEVVRGLGFHKVETFGVAKPRYPEEQNPKVVNFRPVSIASLFGEESTGQHSVGAGQRKTRPSPVATEKYEFAQDNFVIDDSSETGEEDDQHILLRAIGHGEELPGPPPRIDSVSRRSGGILLSSVADEGTDNVVRRSEPPSGLIRRHKAVPCESRLVFADDGPISVKRPRQGVYHTFYLRRDDLDLSGRPTFVLERAGLYSFKTGSGGDGTMAASFGSCGVLWPVRQGQIDDIYGTCLQDFRGAEIVMDATGVRGNCCNRHTSQVCAACVSRWLSNGSGKPEQLDPSVRRGFRLLGSGERPDVSTVRTGGRPVSKSRKDQGQPGF